MKHVENAGRSAKQEIFAQNQRNSRGEKKFPPNAAPHTAAHRKVAELLRQAGWIINDKRVERIWQREGLKVPHKQPKRGNIPPGPLSGG